MTRTVFLVSIFVASAGFTQTARAEQVSYGDSYTCHSNTECKRKCEERGGRWIRDKTGSTWGSCYKRPGASLTEQINSLRQQLQAAEATLVLQEDKAVSRWPTDEADLDGILVMELKPSECAGLGGDIHYDDNCPTGVMCSTHTIDAATREETIHFQCVDEFDN